MNILIPAAGLGTRFKDHYDNPKNMIDVKGEPMLVASARSLQMISPEHSFIFVIPENDFAIELDKRWSEMGRKCILDRFPLIFINILLTLV